MDFFFLPIASLCVISECKGNSIWFVDKGVVSKDYINNFNKKIYTADFKKNPVIHRHHQKHPNDRYAPAWKTLEFMTFGAVLKLYEQLKDEKDKKFIAQDFGVRQPVTFENYMHTIRQVRNACAHGFLLFDLKLPQAIRKGPAASDPRDRNNIIGAIQVIRFVMDQISANRASELVQGIETHYKVLCEEAPLLKSLIPELAKI